MNTKILMTSSSIFMGLLGTAAIFLPNEFLGIFDQSSTVFLSAFVQITGALLFAFAMVNWMSRLNIIGGIYNRPVAIGNLAHFLIGAISLIKVLATGLNFYPAYIICAAYIVFAFWFGKIIFTHPVSEIDK